MFEAWVKLLANNNVCVTRHDHIDVDSILYLFDFGQVNEFVL